MPDDLRIPDVSARERPPLSARPVGQALGSGYRPRRARRSLPSPMVLGAAGLGGLLLVGAVGYAVMGRHPSVVPTIEADSRPLRVKPDNPGGMQLSGAEEFGDDRTAHDVMAPSAEVPAPQALRAQMQQAAPAPIADAAPPPAPTPPAPATPAAPAAQPAAGTPSPLPDTPARPAAKGAAPATPAQAPVQAATQPAAQPPAARPAGATMVQLGALSSEAAARAEWQRLAHVDSALLAGREPVVTRIDRDGRTLWRLRTGGFADVADATGFCARLKAHGGNCTIAAF